MTLRDLPSDLGTQHPLVRASDLFTQRGADLPQAALRALAKEVILRMTKQGRDGGAVVGSKPEAATRPGADDVSALCDALLSSDESRAADMVRAARLGGMAADTLYFDYIAEAVRQLGERWERDEATVAQVIIGSGRVYGILRELRSVFLSDRLSRSPDAVAVFAQVPGEIHTLGVTMAADAMRRRGWQIELKLGYNHDALIEEIARQEPTMIGLSASTLQRTFALARLIVALRVRCPQAWIMVAGQIVPQDAQLATLVDADAVAGTLEEAEAVMEAHLQEMAQLTSLRG
jgi:MerR family transcriptional regulator, light-induced transcriptional regulator